MENENLKQLLVILTQSLEKKDLGEDKSKIQYLSYELGKLEKQIPTYSKLEELKKIVTDLEVKYDDFIDLSYYFDPLYVKIKNIIHAEDVKKIKRRKQKKERYELIWQILIMIK